MPFQSYDFPIPIIFLSYKSKELLIRKPEEMSFEFQ
jgi:hypothetical protein